MKRKLLLAGVIASFLAFASALNGPANAQIGIGRPASVTITGQLELPDGTAGAPAQIFTSDPTTGLFLVGAGNPGYSVSGALVFDLEDTNAAGASANLATISSTLGIMDGSGGDIVAGLSIELTNVDHTGGSVYGINFAAFTGDAQAAEYAINFTDANWDAHIRSGSQIEFGSGTARYFFQDNAGVTVLALDMVGSAGASHTWMDLTDASAIMNGSDTVNGMVFAITNVDHTGTGNTVNLLNLAAIAGDANSNLNGILIGALTGTTGADTPPEAELAINIATGWDFDINGQTDLSFAVDGVDLGTWKVASGTLTATQVRKLNATPVEVIAAVASGSAIVVESVQFMLDWASVGYDSVGAGEDLVLVGDGGADLVRCDNVTCINAAATADAFGASREPSLLGDNLLSADSVSIKILGSDEWADTDNDSDGDSPMHYRIRYRVVVLDLS